MAKYREFREVLRKLGFDMERSQKHEIWKRKEPDGRERTIVLSHQHGKDTPKGLFHRLLKQAGISRDEFERLRKDP
ncbi:MAG: type II toxin-antitoxin system HicA family toxin [Armatimonadetes bacterium]|nr:type II toxin-antitoxin system HicA family toxin [Armatimonadota bacterium]MDW8026987.1 type II toxin-antitoxin system HicA family toxin [Armatimonadota bacterium]